MDAHRFNMVAGGVIGSLLLYLLVGFFSDQIFGVGGHGGHETLAFAVETEGGGEAEATKPKAVDWAALVASADVGKGEKLFKKCAACHKLEEGVDAVGPSLWGVVGRDVASESSFSYSDALKSIGGKWTLEKMAHFLKSPRDYAPGTKMTFAGLKDPQDRVDLIDYLNEADGSPIELAPQQSAKAETETQTETQTDAQTDAQSSAAETDTSGTETAAAATESAPQSEEAAQSDEAAHSDEAAQPTEAAAGAGGGKYAELLASADADAGAKVFRKCKACHTLQEGKNRVGPSLWGVVGRDIGSVEGFNYSDAMAEHPGKWTLSELDGYLKDPKGQIPGNKMSFAGLRDAQDRINVITYLNEADGSPEPLGK